MLAGVAAFALIGLIVALYLYTRTPPAPTTYSEGELRLSLLFTIGGPDSGERPRFSKPLGVAIADDGTIFVSDTGNNRIVAFAQDGSLVREWGQFGIAKPLAGVAATWDPGDLNFPAGIDVGDDGLVYVADFRNDQVCVFDADGRFVRAFPDPMRPVGKGASGQDGTGIAVTDVAVRGDRVYATDAHQVVTFDTSGTVLSQFGKPGTGAGDLDHPAGIATGVGDVLYVSDSNHSRLGAFTTTGANLWSVQSWEESVGPGVEIERFDLPRGVTRTADGYVVVADAVRHELVIVDDNGSVLAALGTRGVRPGEFNFPVDVASRGSTLAVADKENNRVQVFTLQNVPAEKAPQ